MPNVYNVKIDTSGSQAFADLYGVMVDLEGVIQFCHRYIEIWSASPTDVVSLEALSIAALVKYSRCQEKRVRNGISLDLINKLSEADREKHAHFDAIRDKHIAHSINSYEENIPVACVSDDPKENCVRSVSVIHNRVIAIGANDIESLMNLTENLLRLVKEEYKRLQISTLETVKNIPIETLRKFEQPAGFRVQNPKKSRSQKT